MTTWLWFGWRVVLAGCPAVGGATCAPEGVPICADNTCDLAPYADETTGAVLVLVETGSPCTTPGVCAWGTDAHGNEFCCEGFTHRGAIPPLAGKIALVVEGSALDDTVSTSDGAGAVLGAADHVPFRHPSSSLECDAKKEVGLSLALGAGNDTVDATDRLFTTVVADGGDGDDALFGGGSARSSYTEHHGRDPWGFDVCVTERLDDEGEDVFTGGRGADELRGGGFRAGDTLQGGAGDDLLVGGPGPDTLVGGPGSDALNGKGGRDDLDGGWGDDLVCGGRGADVVAGGEDDDVVLGDNAAGDRWVDEVHGGPGVDECDEAVSVGCESPLTDAYACPL